MISRGAAVGGAGGAAAGAGAAEVATNGLSRAREVAGDVLSGIFGAMPWNLDSSSIVDAVSGGADPGMIDVVATAGVVLA